MSGREKQIEVEELRREAEKLEHMLSEIQEDNSMLETDIDKYKGTVRALNSQNEELVSELEKINQQDHDAKSLLNRRERIEALIAKAEAHLAKKHAR